jgi:pyruvate-ferredoxin/flavodoxin oxidoreductase
MQPEDDPKFPGLKATRDGSEAVVWVESHISQAAVAYPITPSTPMGNGFAVEYSNGKRNLWGEPIAFLEPESEHSSASACEGFAIAGGRVTNFTSGQGLILMKEVLYVISGKRLPVVFHIGTRTLTSHALNIHCAHDDVMGVADTGWGMLFARNVQEAADLALIARRTAEDTRTPFFNVQDGFLTTHNLESILLPEPELMQEFIGEPSRKLESLLDVSRPLMSGVLQNQDAYMKGKIAQRGYYNRVPDALLDAMEEFYRLTGRRYQPVMAYRLEDADYAVVGMGTMMETAEIAVDSLRSRGVRAGALHITSFRPFPGKQIVEALKNCKAVTVLERLDEPLAESGPLTREIKAAFAEAVSGSARYPQVERIPSFFAGAAGLGGRDIPPEDFVAVVWNMERQDGKRFFALGVPHELNLPRGRPLDLRPAGSFAMRGHSVGGLGAVTTNKVIATVAADLFGKNVQAYSKYTSEKKGLPTTYYLTLAQERIRTHCELTHADLVVLNDISAFQLGNPLEGLADNGMVFLQTARQEPEQVWNAIPSGTRDQIREKGLRVFYLDTMAIAREVVSSPALVQRMQGIALLGVFLRITPFRQEQGLSEQELFVGVEKALGRYFGKRGAKVIEENLKAVRRGYERVHEVPQEMIRNVPFAIPAKAGRAA